MQASLFILGQSRQESAKKVWNAYTNDMSGDANLQRVLVDKLLRICPVLLEAYFSAQRRGLISEKK